MVQFTTDRTEIEQWAEQHDAVPIRAGDHVELVSEEEMTADHEQIDWETFHRDIDEHNHVVMLHDESREQGRFEVSDHTHALEQMDLEEGRDRSEIENRLLEGETITGKVKETTVIKETIVEEATLESEIVDQDLVDRQVTGLELLERNCQSCSIDADSESFSSDEWGNTERFLAEDTDVTTGETEQYDEYPYTVSVDVDERWSVTIEELEEYTVETRITDVDVTETDTVDTQNIESHIDIDAVHDQLLRSIDLGWSEEHDEVIDTEAYDIESEFTEDDQILTTMTSLRIIEKELSEQLRLTTEVVAGELLSRETHQESVVEGGLAEHREEAETMTAEEDEQQAEGDKQQDTGERVVPNEDDVGKTVVSSGEEIGMITEVEENVAYMDPHPGLTERIMGRLGWGDKDEDDYTVDSDQIERITDEEVQLASDPEE